MDLLTRYVPEFDRCVRHTTSVRADAATVLCSIRETNFGQSDVVRLLLERFCDGALVDFRGPLWAHGLTLDAFQSLGCILLKSHDECEVALGAIVTISAARPTLFPADARIFASFAQPNSIKTIWHFYVAADGAKRSTLTLEARVRGNGGPYAGRLLRRWDAFARFGTLGRRDVIAAIKAAAESTRSSRMLALPLGTNPRPHRPESPP
jgi:hypothetical protein